SGEPSLFAVPGFENNAGAHNVSMLGAHELDPQPVVSCRSNVLENGHRFVHVADNQVNLAVVVQVPQCDPTCQVFLQEIVSAALADVLEFTRLVTKQHGLLPTRSDGGVADGVAVGDEQVLPAVMIDIKKS